MTLSLTNRLAVVACYVLAFVCFSLFLFKSCARQKDEPIYTDNGFDFRTAARMLGATFHVEQDTTKKPPLQQKIVNHSYSLSGSDTLFNLLWLQLNSPIDITPRQLDNLKTWMQKNLKADTTHSK